MRFFYMEPAGIITSDQWLSAGSMAERVFFTTTRAIVGTLASFTELILYRDTEASFAKARTSFQETSHKKMSDASRYRKLFLGKPGIRL